MSKGTAVLSLWFVLLSIYSAFESALLSTCTSCCNGSNLYILPTKCILGVTKA